MKYYVTLFSCLGLGVAGLLYSQRKPELQPIDREEINNAKEEIAQLNSKLTAIKTESAKVELMLEEKSDLRDLDKKRNECLLNQRNIQVVVRSHQNFKALQVGEPLDLRALIASGELIKSMPECPSGEPYTLINTIPEVGQLAATCKHTDKAGKHVPEKTTGW